MPKLFFSCIHAGTEEKNGNNKTSGYWIDSYMGEGERGGRERDSISTCLSQGIYAEHCPCYLDELISSYSLVLNYGTLPFVVLAKYWCF